MEDRSCRVKELRSRNCGVTELLGSAELGGGAELSGGAESPYTA